MHPLVRAVAIVGRPAELLPCALPSAQAPPQPPAPTPMPDLQDPAVLAARQQAMTAAAARSGRLSTIFAGQNGGDYTGSKTGTA